MMPTLMNNGDLSSMGTILKTPKVIENSRIICEDFKEENESSESEGSQGFVSEFDQMNIGDLTRVESTVENQHVSAFEKELEHAYKLNFNILDLSRNMPRGKILPVMTLKYMGEL